MINISYATGATGFGSSSFASFIPLILMLIIFYFLLIRPQQKKNKEHREMINKLKIGDRVVTNGGIYGRITNVFEDVLLIEIADKVKIKITRGSISSVINDSTSSSLKKNGK